MAKKKELSPEAKKFIDEKIRELEAQGQSPEEAELEAIKLARAAGHEIPDPPADDDEEG